LRHGAEVTARVGRRLGEFPFMAGGDDRLAEPARGLAREVINGFHTGDAGPDSRQGGAAGLRAHEERRRQAQEHAAQCAIALAAAEPAKGGERIK
jgi:hypothetical protein